MKLSYKGLKAQLSIHLKNQNLSEFLLKDIIENYLSVIEYSTMGFTEKSLSKSQIKNKSSELKIQIDLILSDEFALQGNLDNGETMPLSTEHTVRQEKLNAIGLAFLELINHNEPLGSSFQNQLFIIDRMQALGYPIDREGLCFGISHMAMQAFLVDDFDTFTERLIAIHQTRLADFKSFSNSNSEKIREFLPFFDGVALYQYPEQFKSILLSNEEKSKKIAQNSNYSLPITAPVDTEKNDGQLMPVKISSFPGTYNRTNLEEYLNVMQENLGDISFSLAIGTYTRANGVAGYHEINLNFDTGNKKWILVDPNYLPPEDYLSTELLADILIERMGRYHSNPEHTLFTECFIQKGKKCEFEAAYSNMMAQDRWKAIHPISASTLLRGWQDGYSELQWALMCSEDPEWINKALEAYGPLQAKDIGLTLCNANPLIIDYLIGKNAIVNEDSDVDLAYSVLNIALKQQWTEQSLLLLTNNLCDQQIDKLIIKIRSTDTDNFPLLPLLLHAKKQPLEPNTLIHILNFGNFKLLKFVYNLEKPILEQLINAPSLNNSSNTPRQTKTIKGLLAMAIRQLETAESCTKGYRNGLNEIKSESTNEHENSPKNQP